MMMLTMRSPPIDVDSYLASACAGYAQAPRQRGSQLQMDGLRATLLYYEAYRSLGFYQSAPNALMRAAGVSADASSPEVNAAQNVADDVEVIGAVLLEQAAIADLQQQPRPHRRRHAAHLVMAAHRYQECGQNALSLRCLRRAARQYTSRAAARRSIQDLLGVRETNAGAQEKEEEEGAEGDVSRLVRERGKREDELSWDAIEAHVEYELGQRAYANGDSTTAVKHFVKLIQPAPLPSDATEEDRAAQEAKHASYLNAFLTAFKYVDPEAANESVARHLNLDFVKPLWDTQTARIITRSTHAVDAGWTALEERYIALALAAGLNGPSNLTLEDRQYCQVNGESQSGGSWHTQERGVEADNIRAANCIVPSTETFHLEVLVRNPLSVALSLKRARVGFETLSGEEVHVGSVTVAEIDSVELGPDEVTLVSQRTKGIRPALGPALSPSAYACRSSSRCGAIEFKACVLLVWNTTLPESCQCRSRC